MPQVTHCSTPSRVLKGSVSLKGTAEEPVLSEVEGCRKSHIRSAASAAEVRFFAMRRLFSALSTVATPTASEPILDQPIKTVILIGAKQLSRRKKAVKPPNLWITP